MVSTIRRTRLRWVLFSIMMITTCRLTGQENVTRWGKPFSSDVLEKGYSILSISAQGMVVLTRTSGSLGKPAGVAMTRFDGSLSFIETKKMQLKLNDKNLDLEFAVNLKNRTLVFSSFSDNKAKKRILYYQEFNAATLAFKQDPVPVMAVDYENKPFTSSGTFHHAISADSGMLALLYNPPSGLKSKEKFSLMVLDENTDTLYRRSEEFSFRDRDFDLKRIVISDSGNVFLSGTLSTGHTALFSKEPNYKYVILLFSQHTERSAEADIDLDKYFVTDMLIGSTVDGKLIAAGFYSELGTTSIRGCFSMYAEAETGRVLSKNTHEFPVELITTGMSEKQAVRVTGMADKGRDVELENYKLDKLIMRSDGGVVLVGEQSYSRTYTSYNAFNGSTTYYTTYYSEGILLAGIDNAGHLDMTQKILKLQRSDFPEYLSYVLTVTGDHMYFIFTDSELNLAAHTTKTSWADFNKNGITSMLSVNAKGTETRSKLYSFDKDSWFVIPGLSLPLDDGSVLLYTVNRNKSRLCLVYLD
jgi:hypothetical protein